MSFANNNIGTYAVRPKILFLFSAGEVRTGHLEQISLKVEEHFKRRVKHNEKTH